MKKDIVKELRYYCDCVFEKKCFSCKCADEIERLRLDVKDLRNVIELLKKADND